MKKIPKINKPISLTSKNIVRIYTDLVRRNANTIRSQNRMSGGLNNDQIKEFQGFLTESAETVKTLKYILLDKLCEHTIAMIAAKNTTEYHNDRYILEKINNSFTDNPELYKYNIAGIEHTDPDINFLINALKLVSSFDSSVSKLKTPGLEEVNSTYTFDTMYIPEKLLNKVDMKDFEKEYREIQKKRGILPVLSPRPSPLPVKETPEEARKRLLRDSLILSRKIVVSPVKKTLLTLTDLNYRIKRYYKITPLLEQSIGDSKCLTKIGEGYEIGNIKLEKKIGSGANAVIYLATINNSDLQLACKITNTKRKRELEIYKWITDNLILKKMSKHFPLTYKTTLCIEDNTTLTDNEKSVNYIEFCNGDLSTLVLTQKDVVNNKSLINNIFYQALICIATYQNRVGYIHVDTHLGNFLYQKNNEEGYYHYIYNGINFYIKSCGYNIIIIDFEFSLINDGKNQVKPKSDYNDLLQSIHGDELGALKQNLTNFMSKLKKNIEIDDNDIFQKMIDEVFLTDKENFTTTPKEDQVINKVPFIINKVEEYLILDKDLSGGRKPTKYKSTGNAVFIMYKKKKYKRTIYVKDKTNTKYCKINNEYILLNKLKVL